MRFRKKTHAALCTIFLFVSFSVSHVNCADFTVIPLKNSLDIAVYEVSGNYDAELPDGSINSAPRQIITREFYKTYPDDYDFLVIFSNFDFLMPLEEASAFYQRIKNDVQGIGIELADNSSLFSSNGVLQGTIDMGNIQSLVSDPLIPGFSDTLGTLSHELLHRWAAKVTFRRDDNSISTDLLGRGGYHWSFLLDTAGSLEYGNRWLDNGNGTFTSHAGRRYYSPLDMYLMGLIDRSEVPPMLLITNPEIDPQRLPEPGVTIEGTPQYVSIDQIIAAEGERIPSAADSQKTFRVGCIFITRPGTFSEDDLHEIRAIMQSWSLWYSGLTNGLAKIVIDNDPFEDLPGNPGPDTPPIDPRTAPPEINDGVAWLLAHQKNDGSWQDSPFTAPRDTSMVLNALAHFTTAVEAKAQGLSWLENTGTANLDYLARKIAQLSDSGHDVAALAADLIDRQNSDGGWGSNGPYSSTPADTALALQALFEAGESSSPAIGLAITYLLREQNADSGWGTDGHSTVQTTIEVLTAFLPFRNQHQLDVPIHNALSWVYSKQNPDGGFDNRPGTVYNTARTLIALKQMGITSEGTDQALSYLLGRQAKDGSWQASTYQTALALQAVWITTRDPDLSVSTAEMVPSPEIITSLPSPLSLAVTVHNSGMPGISDVAEVKVVLYEGAEYDSSKIGEQSISISGQSSETVVFPASITAGRPYHFSVAVDPDNLIKESSEQNNSALRIIFPESTYDFAIVPDGISVSPPAGDIFEPLSVNAAIANHGTIDAFSVPLHLVADRGNGPITVATQTIDLPAGQSVDLSLAWVPEISGASISLSLVLDPHEAFAEVTEDNNAATVTIDVRASTKPDLSLSFADISFDPAPALEGGNTSLRAKVRNRGFSPATDVQVDFYDGVPGEIVSSLLGSVAIPVVSPGESTDTGFDWTNIPGAEERVITVVLDPQDGIDEISEDNNTAFATLQVLSLPDFAVSNTSISFSPEAPREGDSVSVSAVVQNKGEQPAVNIPVAFRAGSDLLGTATIGEIGGNSQEAASFVFETEGKVGIIDVEVIVDPENTILERNRTNNSAVRSVGIQNGDLWLSNNYISPNGDGIKDSTRFGCRLAVPRNVTAEVVNEGGEVVRKFAGPEYSATTYVSLTWDGLDKRGRVVDDGQYRIQVLAETGTIIASLLVTVDTNRSPLLKAFGTPYLYATRTDFLLGDNKYNWLPDDSGVVFHLEKKKPELPEFETGLYSISPAGKEITRLVPPDWSEDADPAIGYRYLPNKSDCNSTVWQYLECDQVNPGFALSDDGDTVAFILEKYNKSTRQVLQQELWSVNRYGEDLVLLDSFHYLEGDHYSITDIFPAPDGAHIAYKLYDQNAAHHFFAIIGADGTGRTTFSPDWGSGFDSQHRLTWAPDGKKLVFSDRTHAVVADIDGSLQEVLPIQNAAVFFDWYGSSRILVRDLNETSLLIDSWAVDLNAPEFPMLIAENVESPNSWSWYQFGGCIKHGTTGTHSVPPLLENGYFLAGFAWKDYPFVDYILCDIYGRCQGADMLQIDWPYPSLTPDAGKIVINDATNATVSFDRETQATELFVFGSWGCDPATWEYSAIPAHYKIWPPAEEDCPGPSFLEVPKWNWLNNKAFLAFYYGEQEQVIAFNIENGERTLFLEGTDAYRLALSPGKRFISYLSGYNRSTKKYSHFEAAGSLLNLTADLRTTKTDTAINLQGIAADLNFAHWQLAYADQKTPGEWRIIAPPADKPVVDGLLATWIPPDEGSFLVRLTVTDKAGNTGWDRKVVTWGRKFSVTDIYPTGELFSPNSDGIKDTVGLNYTVHEPVHLELSVHAEDGRLIKTFYQDHALPGEYGIIWDGRDEWGGIAPDGLYTIRLFDYEFMVQVDTTPPDARLEFSDVECGDEKNPALRSLLSGLALDANLESWTVSYAVGDNPQEWYEFKSGETALLNTGSGIDPLPVSIQSFTSETSPSIGFLGNTTFRIAVEDLAGNRSIVAARFNLELLVLARWDGNRVNLENSEIPGRCESLGFLPLNYIAPGVHSLAMVETLRERISSATVQYRMHMQWHDAGQIVDPPEGEIELAFDTSLLVPEDIAAVRIKIAAAGGMEYYTNSVAFNPPVFRADMGCIPPGSLAPALIDLTVDLPESLVQVTLQATKSEAGAASWEDFAEYAVFDGFPYQFAAPFPDTMPEGHEYPLRFVGSGENGLVYISNELTEPQQCQGNGGGGRPPPDKRPCSKTTLAVSSGNEKAPCNSVNEGKATIAVDYCPYDEPKVLPDKVRYYLEENGAWRFLKEFSPASDGWGRVILATAGLSEGEHPVRVSLVYGESVIEEFRRSVILVDRTLPEARITCPAPSAPFSTRRVVNDLGEVFEYTNLKGIARDANGVASYSLSFGQGRTPSRWFDIAKGIACGPFGNDCEGYLESWDVKGLSPTEYSLRLMVTDNSGNSSCFVTQVDMALHNTLLTAAVNQTLFSPNGDGIQDEASVEYQVGGGAVLAITVWNENALVRTLVSDQEVGHGSGMITWNGLDDAGETVPDGTYQIRVEARDACANVQQETFPVTVDNTPPTTIIVFPGVGEPLDVFTEVVGNVTDVHFTGFQLRAREEASGSVVLLNAGNIFVDNGILGVWNTYGLEGNWALVLSAIDGAGNTGSTSLPVSFGTRPRLISKLEADPKIFSPNNDGKRETTTVTYELTDTANIVLTLEDSLGSHVVGQSTPNTLAGTHQFHWAGLDAGGNTVPDGSYRLKVAAESITPPFVVQVEKITLVKDTLPPAITITAPLESSYHDGLVDVQGRLRDPNLREYQITLLAGGQDSSLLGSRINGSDIVFSQTLDLPDGAYAIHVDAGDAADNAGSEKVSFAVDKTRPRITLESPVAGEYFGGSQTLIPIRGSIDEVNLLSYRVQYGSGTNPSQWVDLASGHNLPPDNLLATWSVGPDQGVADGDYTVRVTALDKAGGESAAQVVIHVDNHPPEIALALPEEGDFVREPFAVIGTVSDPFLREYTLQLAGSACATATNWSVLRTGSQSIQDGKIAALQTLPADGVYCLRLAAEDFLSQASAQQVNFTIDTSRPAPPLLAGSLEGSSDVSLRWQGNGEPDLVGFNLYRNYVKINSALLHETEFLDQGLEAGVYSYTVRAVDLAGWKSGDSNRMVFTVDLTPPEAMITSPRNGGRVGNYVDITGRAYSAEDFKEYRVFCGAGENPQSWQMLRKSPVPVAHGLLVRWDAINLAEGLYTIQLEAEDLNGNVTSKSIQVTVDNTPPAAPLLLTAIPDGSSVALTWQANSEPDLAGYLVYRGGKLANESGTVVGDLTPYLITGLDFAEVNVPDGTHVYYLVAMDRAGNSSDQSNTIAVPLDTRPPHLHIITPSAGLEFDRPIPVRAESEDSDIAMVRFQYRASSASLWTDLGSVLTRRPYAVDLDPSALGWENGSHLLRAVATDLGGLTDANPQEVEVHFQDVTPPSPPAAIVARVNGGFVALSWQQNQEGDLAGYNVYLGTGSVKRNTQLLPDPSYIDPAGTTAGLQNGEYEYQITAVDASGNESEKSRVTATVFTPVLAQPESPVHTGEITVEGSTVPAATVEIFRTLPSGAESFGTAQADARGRFAHPVSLAEGSTTLFAVATDVDHNVSLPSAPFVVIYDIPPAAPTGLVAVVDKADVALFWTANTEPDLAGYNVYRRATAFDWVKINSSLLAASSHSDLALKNDSYRYRVTAVDQTGGESSPSNESPAVIAQQLPVPPLNLRAESVPQGGAIDLCWDPSADPVGGYPIYRSQVAGGPYARVAGGMTLESCFRDSGLQNGTRYFYIVRAMDSFGNESSASNEDSAVAQDVVPPEKPRILLPTVSGRPYQSPAAKVDIVGYTEAGATVDLIHEQEWIDTVDARSEPVHESSFLTDFSAYETVATPDGTTVFYSLTENSAFPYKYSTFRKDLATGVETRIDQIPEGSWNHKISPDGTKLAYLYEDAGWSRIGIYDITAGTVAPLTTAADVDEYEPAWSIDSAKLVFDSDRGDGFYDIWTHDLPSGETARVTHGLDGYFPEISPDGQKITFLIWDPDGNRYNLYLVDADGGTPALLEADVDWSRTYPSIEWSPKANTLAFSAKRDGAYDIHVLDIETGEDRRLTTTESIEIEPQWSPDGRQISYYLYAGGNTQVHLVPADGQAPDRLQHSCAGTIDVDFNWLPAGIFYRIGSDLHRIIPPGTFVFPSVGLHPGQNIFSARAQDTAANFSELADEIFVNVDAADMPDLEVLDQDIFILPESPLAGEEATIGAVVRNSSAKAAENVHAEFYIWDAEDNVELIHSETLPLLAPHAEAWLAVNWDSSNMDGTNTVFVLLDPRHEIAESREDNNSASRDFYVAGEAGVTCETTLNGQDFMSAEEVAVNVALHNSGPETHVRLTVTVEDEQEAVVEELADRNIMLPYGAGETVALNWSAGSVFAGRYQVRTVLADSNGGSIGETVKPFTVLPDLDVAASLTTNKTEYGPDEEVQFALSVANLGANMILPELKVKLTVSDSTVVHHVEEHALFNLYPEESAGISTSWNTARTAPGSYRAAMEVFLENERVAVTATEFAIVPVMAISGTVSVDPKVIFQDGAAQVAYSVAGRGNVEAGTVLLQLLVLDTRDWTTVSVHEETVTLGMEQTINGQHAFAVLPWNIGVYRVLLQSIRAGTAETLATDSFTVRDGVAPSLTILSPDDGSVLHDSFDLAVTVIDGASEVAKAEYQVDKGSWQSLPLVNPATGRYAARWTPNETDEGAHTVRFRATDLAGNVSSPAARVIAIRPRVEMTTAINKTAYGMNEELTVNIALANTAWQKHVHLAVRIETEAGIVVAQVAAEEVMLAADSLASLNYGWNTRSLDAGHYVVRTTLSKNGAVLAEDLVGFSVDEVFLLAGGLSLSDTSVSAGAPVVVNWTVVNTGNFTAAGLTVETLLTDQASTQVQTWTETVSLPKGQSVTGSIQVQTHDLALGNYQFTLKARYESEEMILAGAQCEVLDSTPPEVSVISPAQGAVVAGPIEVAAVATDDAAGVEAVEYRIDQRPWQPLALIDPGGSRYAALWTPEAADEGNRTVSFRARDKSGNSSEPVAVGVLVEHCQVYANLAGSLHISPALVYYGQDVELTYVLANQCNASLGSLNVRVAVLNPDSNAVVYENITTSSIAPGATSAVSLMLPSGNLEVRQYTALLEISQTDHPPRRLAESSFAVLEAVEGENKPLAQTNLLVWLNNGRGNCQDAVCAASARLNTILGMATDSFQIVSCRTDFEQELRNPFHTDIMIIGNQHPLTDHHLEELREKVHSGTGLLAFAWNKPGDDSEEGNGNCSNNFKESFLGVRAKGMLPRSNRTITLADSPVSTAGVLEINDKLVRVEAANDTEVAGRVIDSCGDEDDDDRRPNWNARTCLYPVIVLHEYGIGRTFYAAFNLCDAFTDLNDELLTDLLIRAVDFVHRPNANSELVPHQIKPFVFEVTGTGLKSLLRVSATCPEEITLFDPAANDWVRQYPWEVTLPVQAGSKAVLPYYVLAPDLEGIFACEFSTGLVDGNQYTFLRKFISEFALNKNRMRRLAEAKGAIGNLQVSARERAMRNNALRYLQNVLDRPATNCEQADLNIHDIEKAIDALLAIKSIDIVDIRLQLDTLLRIEQAKCYFQECRFEATDEN